MSYYTLYKMADKGLAYDGAVCLDGSDAAFYMHSGSGDGVKKWMIYLQGGGHCHTLQECSDRARLLYPAGTSHNLAPLYDWSKGQLSTDCATNPVFCNFNLVMVWYCDGFSFAGDRETTDDALPYSQPNSIPQPDGVTKLYYRGRRNLKATLDTLARDHGLDQATDIMLSGGSAGGIAAYFAADWVRDHVQTLAPGLQKYKVMSTSGYFNSDPDLSDVDVYKQRCHDAMVLHNGFAGVNANCLQQEPRNWMCGCSDIHYPYIESPLFVHNAVLDSYDLWWHYLANSALTDATWTPCWGNVSLCSNAQMVTLNKRATRIMTVMQRAAVYHKAGNGAFVHSCWNLHVEAWSDVYWTTITMMNRKGTHINTMQEASVRWWNSDSDAADEHTYEPCAWSETSVPRECNPTCLGQPYGIVLPPTSPSPPPPSPSPPSPPSLPFPPSSPPSPPSPQTANNDDNTGLVVVSIVASLLFLGTLGVALWYVFRRGRDAREKCSNRVVYTTPQEPIAGSVGLPAIVLSPS